MRRARIGTQRVLIKTRVVRTRPTGAKNAVMAHLAYVTRHGVGIDGEQSAPFDAAGTVEAPDIDAFAQRAIQTRHQFRFIVSPERGSELDLEMFTRELMVSMAGDLGTGLDWMAVAHHDTANAHVHVTLNGVTDCGQDLVISRDYLSLGMRARAGDMATRELGLRTEQDIAREQDHEVVAERLTGIDRQLIRLAQQSVAISSVHLPIKGTEPSPFMEIDLRCVPAHGQADALRRRSLQLGRLRALERLGLAGEASPGQWLLDGQIVPRLQQLGRRGDIIKTMHAHARGIDVGESLAIQSTGAGTAAGVTGRVMAVGQGDAYGDASQEGPFLIIEGVDGRSAYMSLPQHVVVEERGIGTGRLVATSGDVCRVGDVLTLKPTAIDEAGRVHGPGMTLVRHDTVPLREQVELRAPTWMDDLLADTLPAGSVKSSFQQELGAMLEMRLATLARLGLASRGPDGIDVDRDLRHRLHLLARADAGRVLEATLGDYVPLEEGSRMTGVVDRVVTIPGGAHAVVRSGARFTLVPLSADMQDAGRLVGRDVEVALPLYSSAGAADLLRQRALVSARIRILALDLSQQRDLGLGR